ncbi:MAG: nucleotidyltransferase domain-containing protein [Lachnospiraceae bacterium]|nr:nucleotidyltransferase domain-containing protein [Lachnospiraceae bacterium]
MCTKPQLNIIISGMVELYRRIYGSSVDSVFLYGSYARDDAGEESDVDIAAIVHGDRNELQKKLTELWAASDDLGMENEVVISPVVIPYDEFEKYRKKLPYYRNIDMEGRRVG